MRGRGLLQNVLQKSAPSTAGTSMTTPNVSTPTVEVIHGSDHAVETHGG